MKMDRNVNPDGKGKYALVRLRSIEPVSEAGDLLRRLDELGHLDWGLAGEKDEFFVIKLRDRFSDNALKAYSEAVMNFACTMSDEHEALSMAQWAIQVNSLRDRAGDLSEFEKTPD